MIKWDFHGLRTVGCQEYRFVLEAAKEMPTVYGSQMKTQILCFMRCKLQSDASDIIDMAVTSV